MPFLTPPLGFSLFGVNALSGASFKGIIVKRTLGDAAVCV
jgi:hypothetical protein